MNTDSEDGCLRETGLSALGPEALWLTAVLRWGWWWRCLLAAGQLLAQWHCTSGTGFYPYQTWSEDEENNYISRKHGQSYLGACHTSKPCFIPSRTSLTSCRPSLPLPSSFLPPTSLPPLFWGVCVHSVCCMCHACVCMHACGCLLQLLSTLFFETGHICAAGVPWLMWQASQHAPGFLLSESPAPRCLLRIWPWVCVLCGNHSMTEPSSKPTLWLLMMDLRRDIT